jgi:hypothetical protein
VEASPFIPGLAEFILNPKRFQAAFELITRLASMSCFKAPEVLPDRLRDDGGCQECLSCQARGILDPTIHARWFRVARQRGVLRERKKQESTLMQNLPEEIDGGT